MNTDPEKQHEHYRIATFAVPLSGNKGSASMLLGLIDGLVTIGNVVEYTVFSYYPKRDSEIAKDFANVQVAAGHPKHLPMLCLKCLLHRAFRWTGLRLFPKTAGQLADCDAAFLMGGTTFADSMLYKVPWNVAAAIPALLLGRPVYFLSQTIGPVKKCSNRVLARWVLGRATEVHGRGHQSTANIESLGVDRSLYGPDLSFAMKPINAAESSNLKKWTEALTAFRKNHPSALIGITPNTIVEQKMSSAGIDYADLIAAIIVDLSKRGHRCVMIPHSFLGRDQGQHNNDVNLCLRIIDGIGDRAKCLFVESDLNSQELRCLISNLDLLIASRFHSMISALAVGVTPVTIGWGDQKYLEVLEIYGLEDLYIDYSQASFQGIKQIALAALEARARHTEHIKAITQQTVEECHERLGAVMGQLS